MRFKHTQHISLLNLFQSRFAFHPLRFRWPPTSLVTQRVKRLSAMQETRVRSLSQEDPLEKEIATHSSTLAWRIPWTEELGSL